MSMGDARLLFHGSSRRLERERYLLLDRINIISSSVDDAFVIYWGLLSEGAFFKNITLPKMRALQKINQNDILILEINKYL